MKFILRIAGLIFGCALLASSCVLQDSDPPELTGPSELGTSIAVSANPDVLPQDGRSESVITVEARDANSQPIRNLALRLEISVRGISADFGRLSARTVVTGSDGRASLTYTAPPAPPVPVDNFTIVDILAVPIGRNFANAVPRAVSLRLTPPGIVYGPQGPPVADFFFSPQNPGEGTSVVFDASASRSPGVIVGYNWSFGDGSTGSGMRTTHSFSLRGQYNVQLTVVDDRGQIGSTTKAITIATTANPVADFVISPTGPRVGQTISFDGTVSTAPPGRTIASWSWNFGDNTPLATGSRTTHVFTAPGTYAIVLLVTDSAGSTGTATKTLTVLP